MIQKFLYLSLNENDKYYKSNLAYEIFKGDYDNCKLTLKIMEDSEDKCILANNAQIDKNFEFD